MKSIEVDELETGTTDTGLVNFGFVRLRHYRAPSQYAYRQKFCQLANTNGPLKRVNLQHVKRPRC